MPGTPATDDATTTFAIDNSQAYSVISRRKCQRITVQEDCDSSATPTADLIQAVPFGAVGIKVTRGSQAIYTPINGQDYFYPGDLVGSIKTSAGSITVQQVHRQKP